MTGTILNIVTVLLGGSLGLLFGARLPDRIRTTVVAGLGLFTAAIGFDMASEMQEPIVVLAAMLIGGILGEWWQIEERLRNLGRFLEQRFMPRQELSEPTQFSEDPVDQQSSAERGGSRFIRGFLTASLVFCVGPMTILGSIQDGLTGDYSLLAIKSILDGFAALAFASSLGVGVLFSTLVILLYQGGISLLAAQANAWISDPMMVEMTATGGILLLGVALSSLLEIKPIRVANFLPALFLAPLFIALLSYWGLL